MLKWLRSLVSHLVIVLYALAPSHAQSMEFSFVYQTLPDGSPWAKDLNFVGIIEPGDHLRLLDLIRREPTSYYMSTGVFRLNSKGGDVHEALKIAAIVRRSYPRVFIDKECASACLFIFLSGAVRFGGDHRLGIHRPTYHQSYFQALSATQVQAKYAELDREARQYLEEVRFPQYLIERMFSTSSRDVYWLTDSDTSAIGEMPPWHHEMALARCEYAKMDRARTSEEADAYLKQYGGCLAALVRPEKFQFIDEVLGSTRNDGWQRTKRSLTR